MSDGNPMFLSLYRRGALKAAAMSSPSRLMGQAVQALLPAALTALLVFYGNNAAAFDFNDVAARAKALAGKSYKKPADRMPKEIKDLSYEQSRGIHFKSERSYWRNEKLPFEMTFIHPGGGFIEPVKINEVVGGVAREIAFSPALFDYGR